MVVERKVYDQCGCNENYYSSAYVDKFLAKVQAMLFEGLGVSVKV
jgi:hypothetical protein